MMMLDNLRKKHEIIKAVAYARFSSDMQREESIDAQLRAIQKFADDNGIVIIEEYCDRAKSGTSSDRQEFQRMLDDSTNRQFQLVLVHKTDRFSRNRRDSLNSKFHLKRNGITVIAVMQLYDSETAEGMMMESMLEMMAEYYSKNLSKEVMKGMKENAYKGLHTGGLSPLGYDVDKATKKLVINEYEANIVRLIFKRFLEGYGYGEIINELNFNGYRTKKGNAFAKNSLNSILQNEKYTGTYIYNKVESKNIDGKKNSHKYKDSSEIIKLKNAIPVIIPQDDFDKVQEKMSKRKQTRNSSRAIETYLLRTKIFCGVCGGAYIGGRRKKGSKDYYWSFYNCNKRYRTKSVGCNNKDISRDFIEGMVLEKLSEYVFNDLYIPKITKEYNNFLKGRNSEFQNRFMGYQKRLQDTQKSIDNIVDILLKTQSQALLDRLNDSEKEKVLIESEIEKLQRENKQLDVSQEQMRQVFVIIRESLKTGNVRTIKQIIDTYVSKILVYPDSVTIHFNFFPDISIELEQGEKGKEKDRPVLDYESDSQRQSLSSVQYKLHECTVENGCGRGI